MISILSNFVNKVAHILKYQVVHSYKGIEKLKGTWAETSKFKTTVQSGSNINTMAQVVSTTIQKWAYYSSKLKLTVTPFSWLKIYSA